MNAGFILVNGDEIDEKHRDTTLASQRDHLLSYYIYEEINVFFQVRRKHNGLNLLTQA
ncbi:hypothetical protein GCM10011506_33670 [Marivirga lumbricoides]|uniref:Uncharacterized protein n=2 Tax=Marivirga lumbricoides TaxID=1046115 RepID=A0ABQ1MRF0_9BACT|nr:hypothetical protein GCM10011506_33670 [Marivirga lumbricoides]